MKEVGGEGKEGILPALLLAPFSARSLTLVPCSLLLNRTETLAKQAINEISTRLIKVKWPPRSQSSSRFLSFLERGCVLE